MSRGDSCSLLSKAELVLVPAEIDLARVAWRFCKPRVTFCHQPTLLAAVEGKSDETTVAVMQKVCTVAYAFAYVLAASLLPALCPH